MVLEKHASEAYNLLKIAYEFEDYKPVLLGAGVGGVLGAGTMMSANRTAHSISHNLVDGTFTALENAVGGNSVPKPVPKIPIGVLMRNVGHAGLAGAAIGGATGLGYSYLKSRD